jgi:hypothetical protein
MNTILFATLLLLFGCTAPENPSECQEVAKAQVIDTTALPEVYFPTFEIYGELVPSDYLDGRAEEDSLTTAYGFKLIRVSGCLITPNLVKSVKLNNTKANDHMIKLRGENWVREFEDETGMNISFPR